MRKVRLLLLATLLQMLFSTYVVMAEEPAPEMLPEEKLPAKKAIKQSKKNAKKTVATKKEAVPVYLKTPFDPKIDKISVPFYGHDIEQIYRSFGNRKKSAKKDEFETTEQYQKRLANEAAAPLFDTVTPDGTFVFTVAPETKYDADSQTLTISIRPEAVWQQGSSIDKSRLAIKIKDESNSKATVGQNAYGAKVEMTERYGKDYSIAVHNFDSFETTITYSKWELEQKKRDEEMAEKYPSLRGSISSHISGTKTIEHKITIPPAEAKNLKEVLSLLVLGKSVSPNTSYGAYLSKATYDSPTESFQQFYYVDLELQEFWVYNKSTGRIIGKIFQKDNKVSVSE